MLEVIVVLKKKKKKMERKKYELKYQRIGSAVWKLS